jgi:hypothetical protein
VWVQQAQGMQAQLDDWPNLARYHAENEALPAVKSDEKRVVFFGDSITDAWGRSPTTGVFFPGKPYVNRGISGQTTPQMLVRFQQDVVHLHPAAVVILAGTNDIAGNTGPTTQQMIEDNFTSMAEIAKQSGIKVVLASITPAYAYPWKPEIQPVERIRELNQWLKNFCSRSIWTITAPWRMGRAPCCLAFRRMAFTRRRKGTPLWRPWPNGRLHKP